MSRYPLENCLMCFSELCRVCQRGSPVPLSLFACTACSTDLASLRKTTFEAVCGLSQYTFSALRRCNYLSVVIGGERVQLVLRFVLLHLQVLYVDSLPLHFLQLCRQNHQCIHESRYLLGSALVYIPE